MLYQTYHVEEARIQIENNKFVVDDTIFNTYFIIVVSPKKGGKSLNLKNIFFLPSSIFCFFELFFCPTLKMASGNDAEDYEVTTIKVDFEFLKKGKGEEEKKKQ